MNKPLCLSPRACVLHEATTLFGRPVNPPSIRSAQPNPSPAPKMHDYTYQLTYLQKLSDN
jgi:hypothetical protein